MPLRGMDRTIAGAPYGGVEARTRYFVPLDENLEVHRCEIAPVIPAAWPGFRAVRKFRGRTYRIMVNRMGPGNVVPLADGEAADVPVEASLS